MLLAINSAYQPSDYLPILIQFGLAVAFVAFAMVVSHLVGPKRHSTVKDASFECGIESVGNARTPISVKYFLTAILFVLGRQLSAARHRRLCGNDNLHDAAHGRFRLRYQKRHSTLERGRT
jgi:hypothetical protein